MQRLTPYRPPEPQERETVIPQPDEPTISAGRCPFLGTKTDPGTALAFPSDANHCNRTRLPVPVSLIHQETYCLSTRYTSCPVYRQNVLIVPEMEAGLAVGGIINETAGGTLSNGRAMADASRVTPAPAAAPRKRHAFSFTSLLILIVILGLAFLAWQSWQGYLAERNSETTLGDTQSGATESVSTPLGGDSGQQVLIPPTPLVTNAAVPGAGAEGEEVVASAVPTLEATEATPVAQPTSTPTPEAGGLGALPGAGSATPETECGPPQWWVRVVVESGDTVESLAETRGVSVVEVLHANCLESGDSLTAGRTIFLPPMAVIVTLEPTATPIANSGTGNAGQPLPPPFPFPTSPPFFPTPIPTQSNPNPTNTAEPEPPDPDPNPPRPTTQPTSQPTTAPTVVPSPSSTPPVTFAPTRIGSPTATPPVPPTAPVTSTPPTPDARPSPSPTPPPTRTPPSDS